MRSKATIRGSAGAGVRARPGVSARSRNGACPPSGHIARRGTDASPAWITPELVALTRRVWEPRYGRELSAEEVRTILRNVADLFAALSVARGGNDDEAIRGAGTGVEP